MAENIDPDLPLFSIAVAAELSNMHPQTLRQYDRLGLVSPQRTPGQSRRYTLHNIAQLREVAKLSSEGVNLEGIARILKLEEQVLELNKRVKRLESALADELMKRPGGRVFSAGAEGNVVPLKPGTRGERSGQVVVWRPFNF